MKFSVFIYLLTYLNLKAYSQQQQFNAVKQQVGLHLGLKLKATQLNTLQIIWGKVYLCVLNDISDKAT